MKTINHIVTWYYGDKDFRRLISFYLSNDEYYIEEAIQHIALIILEYKNKDLLINMIEKELRYFINQIIRKQLYSDQSSFFKTFKKQKQKEILYESKLDTQTSETDYFKDDEISFKRIHNKNLIKEIKKYLEIKKLKSRQDFIDSSLYMLYQFSDKTHREISSQLLIPKSTTFLSIKNVEKEIKKYFEDKYKKINE